MEQNPNIENTEKSKELNFQYSIERETRRVLKTIEDIWWFKKEGYKWENFGYPKGLDINKVGSGEVTYSEEEIRSLVENEYEVEVYEKIKTFFETEWNKISEDFRNKLRECSLPIPENYKIILTKYGTGGSYDIPNLIFLNTSFLYMGEKHVFKTLMHEMVHLAIEELIRKFKVGQWQKERIVDLISAEFSSDLKSSRVVPIDTKEIDKIFEKEYPNIEEIIKQIGELKSK